MSDDQNPPADTPEVWEDELSPHIERAKEDDPRFLAAYEDAEEFHRLLDTLVGFRRHWKLSQTLVAQRMGVRQPTVSQFENEGNDPRISTLQRYARAVEAKVRFSLELPAECNWVPVKRTGYRGSNEPPREARVDQGGLARSWTVDQVRRNVGWELAG